MERGPNTIVIHVEQLRNIVLDRLTTLLLLDPMIADDVATMIVRDCCEALPGDE